MRTIKLAEATGSLAQYARHARKAPLLVTSRGKPIAALVRVGKDDMEDYALACNPKFVNLINRSRVRQSREGGCSSVEMRSRLGISPKAKK